MVWKFCGKAQFPHSFGAFPQNFHTMKLGEITLFYTVYRTPLVGTSEAAVMKPESSLQLI